MPTVDTKDATGAKAGSVELAQDRGDAERFRIERAAASLQRRSATSIAAAARGLHEIGPTAYSSDRRQDDSVSLSRHRRFDPKTP